MTIVHVVGSVTDARAGSLLRRYRERFGGPELPVPVESIAEDLLGLSIEQTDLDVSGMLLPAERRIFTRSSEPRPRQRFTLAHELGHWVCQCLAGETEPVYCRAEDIGDDLVAKAREREANVFAAELLMPEAPVRQEFAKAGSAKDLANRFGVSEDAMSWRLYNFGLMSERPV